MHKEEKILKNDSLRGQNVYWFNALFFNYLSELPFFLDR